MYYVYKQVKLLMLNIKVILKCKYLKVNNVIGCDLNMKYIELLFLSMDMKLYLYLYIILQRYSIISNCVMY